MGSNSINDNTAQIQHQLCVVGSARAQCHALAPPCSVVRFRVARASVCPISLLRLSLLRLLVSNFPVSPLTAWEFHPLRLFLSQTLPKSTLLVGGLTVCFGDGTQFHFQGGNQCHNPDFLGISKQLMVFERFIGDEVFAHLLFC